MKFVFTMVLTATIAMGAPGTAAEGAARVRVDGGVLQGTQSGTVTAYLGIPYAAPPIADRRWRAPEPPVAWTGVRKADHFGASCQQAIVPGNEGFGPWRHEYLPLGTVSEDCLFLNIWSPAKSATEKLPILFWIHGGGFVQGSADVPVYDGAQLAAQGMVVVSINYRLGLYGFLAHPRLTAEGCGNYGLRDQIEALNWVHKNIAVFGGDPARITIAGQSAGAASVHFLITSALAKGLFHQAIAQSGTGMGLPVLTKAEAEKQGVQFATAAGADAIAKLRDMSPTQLGAVLQKLGGGQPMGGMWFAPYRDGTVVPADPTAALANGTYNDSPLLTGLNNDELSGMDPQYAHRSATDYSAVLSKRYGGDAKRFAGLYPIEQAQTSEPALSRDRGVASMLFWAEERRKTSRFPVFAYVYTHTEPGPNSERFRTFHSSEIPYVFDTLTKSPERPFTSQDKAIAKAMGKYWVAYIKTGSPNIEGLAPWPALDSKDQVMKLGDQFGIGPAMDPQKMETFRAYVREGGSLSLF
jgi:para-nitrobenzyl esterase